MERFSELLHTYRIPLILCLVGVVLIVGGSVTSNLFQKPIENIPEKSIVKADSIDASVIKIDISGAVNTPGVHSLKKDSRVEDAIKEAGGFSENANAEYISKNINLSQKVTDGQKIYIPFVGEVGGIPQVSGASTSTQIGINSATPSELESLTGIGPATAQKVIAGRPYEKIEDLVSKKVVGKAVFDKIKEQINVN